MLEILAPAGNVQCAHAAIHAGADAIYLGYSAFSARQSADNFDVELDNLRLSNSVSKETVSSLVENNLSKPVFAIINIIVSIILFIVFLLILKFFFHFTKPFFKSR